MKSLLRTIGATTIVCSLILPLTACGDGTTSSSTDSPGSSESVSSSEDQAHVSARQKLGGKLAAMTPAQIEGTLTGMSFDGEPLVAEVPYTELTETTRSEGERIRESLDDIQIEPKDCLELSRLTDASSLTSDLAYVIAAATESHSVAVIIQKIDSDVSEFIDHLVEFADECPEYTMTLADTDMSVTTKQSAQRASDPPLAQGAILSHDQQVQGDSNSNQTMNLYTVDPTNGIVVWVQAPGTVKATDLETQSRLLLEHLATG